MTDSQNGQHSPREVNRSIAPDWTLWVFLGISVTACFGVGFLFAGILTHSAGFPLIVFGSISVFWLMLITTIAIIQTHRMNAQASQVQQFIEQAEEILGKDDE